MKIDKITICNLTSIAGVQTVDFRKEPLRSAGLFAITGSTGSGKTTILDAICLALYEKSPRFDVAQSLKRPDLDNLQEGKEKKISTQDVRSLLRQGCREGYASVEFSVNGKERYEAKWSVNRNRNNNYNRAVRSFKRIAPGEENFPDDKDLQRRINDVIGLDYLQFTRTVLLAQNSFTNFLNAKTADKSALLEKMTGTEIYGKISAKIYELTHKAENAKNLQNTLLEKARAKCLDERELKETVDSLSLLDSQLKNATQRLNTVKERLKWLGNYDKALEAVEQLEQAFNQVNKACATMRGPEQELQRYDKVQTAQPLYQNIKMRERDIKALQVQEEQNSKLEEQWNEKVTETKSKLDTAIERSKNAEEQLRQRQPDLKQGYALSGEIVQTENLLVSLKKELDATKASLESSQTNLAGKKRDYKNTSTRMEDFQQRKQALSVHQSMFENYELVREKFNQLTAMADSTISQHKQLDDLQQKKTSLANSKDLMTKELQGKEAKRQTLVNDLKLHIQANHGRDGEVLQSDYLRQQETLAKLENARILWQRISDAYENISENLTATARGRMDIEQTKKQIDKMSEELEKLSNHFKFLERQNTLSQSKEISLMRKELEEGRACPVCGATHHPYNTTNNRALGDIQNANEGEYVEAELKLNRMNRELAALRESYSGAEAKLKVELVFLERQQAQVKKDAESWAAYKDLAPSFSDCSNTVNSDARKIMIEQLIENTSKAKTHLQESLETYNRHQAQINNLNVQLSAVEVELTADRERMNNIESSLKVTITQIDNVQRSLQEAERQSGEIYERLDSMVTLPAWFVEWQRNRDALRNKITTLYEDWRTVNTGTENTQRDLTLLEQSIKEYTQAVTTSQTQWQQYRDKCAQTTELLESKRKELKLLFGDNSPEAEAMRLDAEITKAKLVVGTIQEAYNKANDELQHVKGTGKNLFESRMNNQAEISQLKSELDIWISKFNSENSPIQFTELESIFTDTRDWNALREEISSLAKQLSSITNKLEGERNKLVELKGMLHIGDDEDDATNSREVLTNQQRELEASVSGLDEKVSALKAKVAYHKQYVKDMEDAQKELDKATDIFNEWDKLNVLLGSADGKKFRELAQSYTFSVLVDQANKQLSRLTPRYNLSNLKGTLGLEIVDHEMCDERRYVNSLSGGETFVVSLALALGLSSISSNSLSIGSLFIDEGFGNLDRDSLDLVMNALSNLENSEGRKVGVISHTEQIRSQISPQIQLVKLARDGQSRIEIV